MHGLSEWSEATHWRKKCMRVKCDCIVCYEYKRQLGEGAGGENVCVRVKNESNKIFTPGEWGVYIYN